MDMVDKVRKKGYEYISGLYTDDTTLLVFKSIKEGYYIECSVYDIIAGTLSKGNQKYFALSNPYNLKNYQMFLKREGVSTCIVDTHNILYTYKDFIPMICSCGEYFYITSNELLSKKKVKCENCRRIQQEYIEEQDNLRRKRQRNSYLNKKYHA